MTRICHLFSGLLLYSVLEILIISDSEQVESEELLSEDKDEGRKIEVAAMATTATAAAKRRKEAK